MCRGVASSEAEMSHPLEGRFATLERGRNDLPSSKAEIRGAVEGSRREPSSEAEIVPRAREGGE